MSEHFPKISLWGKNKDRRDMGGGMFFRHPPIPLDSLRDFQCFLHFLVYVSKIIFDDFVYRSFDLFVILFIRQLIRCPCDATKIRCRVIAFLLVIQHPFGELVERIIRVVNCSQCTLSYIHSLCSLLSIQILRYS